jgi:hypothetical protein
VPAAIGGGGGGGDTRCDWGGAYCWRCGGRWLTCAAVTDASTKYVLLAGVCRCRCCCCCWCCCGENCDGNGCWDGLCGWAPVDVLCGADVGASVVLSLVLVGPEVKKELRSGDRGTYVPSPDMVAVNKTNHQQKEKKVPQYKSLVLDKHSCCKRRVALWRSFFSLRVTPRWGNSAHASWCRGLVGGFVLLSFCAGAFVLFPSGVDRRTEWRLYPRPRRANSAGGTPLLVASQHFVSPYMPTTKGCVWLGRELGRERGHGGGLMQVRGRQMKCQKSSCMPGASLEPTCCGPR